MGRNFYLTDKEISALRDASGEWCDILEEGDSDSCEMVAEKLNNGLGSALKKLYKGTKGERLYEKY